MKGDEGFGVDLDCQIICGRPDAGWKTRAPYLLMRVM